MGADVPTKDDPFPPEKLGIATTVNTVGSAEEDHAEIVLRSNGMSADTTESNTLRFNAKEGGVLPGISVASAEKTMLVAKKVLEKLSTAKSMFNAIDTIETVSVVESVGVDVALSTNMSIGTTTDTNIKRLSSCNNMGGTLGVVAPFAVSCTAR